MSGKKKTSILQNRALIGFIFAAGVIALFVYTRSGRSQGDEQTTYEFGEVERGNIRNSVSATGTVTPWKTVDVKSNVAGRIDKLAVDLGDRVQAGQLIALIDPTDSEVSVAQAHSDVMSSQAAASQAAISSAVQPILTDLSIQQASADLTSAKKNITQAVETKRQLQQQLSTLRDVTIPQDIENASTDLQQADANLKSAEAEYSRQKQLLAKGYAAQSEVDAAMARVATLRASASTASQRYKTIDIQNKLAIKTIQAQVDRAQAAVEGALAGARTSEAALNLARNNAYQNKIKSEQVTAARAQVARSKAELRQAATNLGYTSIRAPRSGVVIQKNVEEGTVVPSSRGSIGSTNALLQIGDTSRLWIICQVDETDIAQVSQGQRVVVNVDAYPDEPVEGKVIRIDPQAKLDQNVTTIPVTVELDHTNSRFKPGMNAECEFIVGEVHNVLSVPNEALIENEKRFVVQILLDGKPIDRPVTIGVQGPERTEILSGLKDGETVITKIIEPEETDTNPFANGPPGGRNQRNTSGGRQGSSGGGSRNSGPPGGR